MLVGTSGFAYLHWARAFYPDGLPQRDRLAYYARLFRTVELNVTFYRLPDRATFEAWRDQVPDDFVFALKASRYLTHIDRLRDPRRPVEELMERAGGLGNRLGPVLLQLPPRMAAGPDAADRLERTADAFRASSPSAAAPVRLALEPRHASWFTPEIRDVLVRRGIALCLADRRGPRTPVWQTADFLYLRFHEGRANPPSCYGRAALRAWAGRAAALAGPNPPGFAFFNNDIHACAIANARTFGRRLARLARLGRRDAPGTGSQRP